MKTYAVASVPRNMIIYGMIYNCRKYKNPACTGKFNNRAVSYIIAKKGAMYNNKNIETGQKMMYRLR